MSRRTPPQSEHHNPTPNWRPKLPPALPRPSASTSSKITDRRAAELALWAAAMLGNALVATRLSPVRQVTSRSCAHAHVLSPIDQNRSHPPNCGRNCQPSWSAHEPSWRLRGQCEAVSGMWCPGRASREIAWSSKAGIPWLGCQELTIGCRADGGLGSLSP